MEPSASLRSLEAFGRSFGTERPSNTLRSREPATTPFPAVSTVEEDEPSAPGVENAAAHDVSRPDPARDNKRDNQMKRAAQPGGATAGKRKGVADASERPGAGGVGTDRPSVPGEFAEPLIVGPEVVGTNELQPFTEPGSLALGTGPADAAALGALSAQGQQTTKSEARPVSLTAVTTPAAPPPAELSTTVPPLEASASLFEEAGTADAPGSQPRAVSTPVPAEAPITGPAGSRIDGTVPLPEPAPEPLTTPADIERAGAILKQVRVALTANMREAVIHLSPPELGRISIRLKVEEGRASAIIRAESVEALEVLTRHIPELRASLEQHNLSADEIEIGLGFEESGHGSERSTGDGSEPAGSTAHENGHSTRSVDRSALARVVAGIAGIDMYA